MLYAIWNKATELLNDNESICRSPGGNTKDHIVKSSSGPRTQASMHVTMNVQIGSQWECALILLQLQKKIMIFPPLLNG